MSNAMKIAMLMGGGGSYWIGAMYATGTQQGYSVTTGANGNIYVCGLTTAGGYVAKFDSSFNLAWQVNISNSAVHNLYVDSSDNVFVVGGYVAANTDVFAAKLTSAGAFVWSRRITYAYTDTMYGVTADSSGNVYITGSKDSGGSVGLLTVFKLSSAGVVVWDKEYYEGTSCIGYSVITDNTDLYVTGRNRAASNGLYTGQFLRLSCSTGAIVAQKTYTSAVSNMELRRSCFDPTKTYIYAAAINYGGPCNIFKLDLNGAVQWQRSLDFGTSGQGFDAVVVDAAGNAYFGGTTAEGVGDGGSLAKYSAAGSLLWQRKFVGAGQLRGLAVLGSSVLACGVMGADPSGVNNGLFAARVPADGSHTGAYTLGGVSLAYTATSGTDAAGTLGSATSSMTAGGTSTTNDNTTITSVSAASLTRAKTSI